MLVVIPGSTFAESDGAGGNYLFFGSTPGFVQNLDINGRLFLLVPVLHFDSNGNFAGISKVSKSFPPDQCGVYSFEDLLQVFTLS